MAWGANYKEFKLKWKTRVPFPNIYKSTSVILFSIYWLVDKDSNLYLYNLTFKKKKERKNKLCYKKLSLYKLALEILDDWRRTFGQTILKLTIINAVQRRNFSSFNPENNICTTHIRHTHTQHTWRTLTHHSLGIFLFPFYWFRNWDL